MTRSGESEQRLAEALRARATGAGRVGGSARGLARGGSDPDDGTTRLALIVALGIGIAFGVVLALISLLAPGALPPLG